MKKTILVTGGSRGIGKAIVEELAKQGHNVVLNYNKSEDKAKEIQKNLQSLNCTVEIFKADVSKSNEVDKLIEFVISKFENIDILINNAGISKWGLFTDLDESEWEEIINTNLKSVFLTSKRALKHMISNKEGLIINMSSIWGQIGASCEVAYSASKAGVIGFTKALAKEVALSNIRVNSIAPGYIQTDMNKFTKEEIEDIKNEIPLNKLGNPNDVVRCIKWLMEDEYTTGQVIGINGGWNI